MPGKTQNIYVCSNCDAQFSKWSGRCLECGSWGTLKMETRKQEEVDYRLGGKAQEKKVSQAEIIDLEKIKEDGLARIKTNISELDRVLGGGIVPGSLVLLSGEPGIGKSTIVAQLADAIGASHGDVIYLSGEESAAQIKARLVRLKCNLEKIKFVSETNVEKAIAAVSSLKPGLVIVDSIQAVYSHDVPTEAGGLSQIRAAAVKFLELAKENNIAVILVGHITKDGQIAGPKSLEHIVDTVIYLEAETTNNYRVLRATKNRFGSVNELGIFEMTGSGFKEVVNPGAVFIETGEQKITGSVISCVIEGTRPFLVEIQALVTKTVFGYPQRKSSGFDLNRLQVLASVLTKRAKVNLINQDIILNVVGGLRINDPGLDLAVCLAITSSLLNQVIDRKTIVLGEVGLGGEVRNVSKLEQRLAEAEKLGFVKAIVPDCQARAKKLKLVKIKNLEEMVGRIAHIA
ncbi:MAG: DNA repair protein RadA [Patescibacteria group bacterium]|nr:DNA repair protein RadA [Patescibacteria group bacterium]MDD5294614.1 DNA repair protein RadA [Patescibacteria group bacterium]MDD5555021.1 DNA repair protein RadA [Patescibacteria group bacterium]